MSNHSNSVAEVTVETTIDTSPLLSKSGSDRSPDQDAVVTITLHQVSVDPNSDATGASIGSTESFLSKLANIFSWRFLSWLAIDQFCVMGGSSAIVMAAALPIFKGMGIDAARHQLYTCVMLSPWALKPFVGTASDLFAIQGYNKRYFVLLSILVAGLGSLSLLVIYYSGILERAMQQGANAVEHLADMIVICFTAINFHATTSDNLGQGKSAEMMNLHPKSGSSLMTFKYGCKLVGIITTQAYVGPFSDAGYFNVLIWICLVLSLTPLLPTLLGWLPENVRTEDERGLVKLSRYCLFDKGRFEEKKMPFIIITFCGLSVTLLIGVMTYARLEVGLALAAALLLAFIIATYCIFPTTFFWVFLSLTLQALSMISTRSALQYYYTASEECVPGGPNFDYTYYISVTGILGSILNLFALYLYENYMYGLSFRKVLILLKVLCCLGSVPDLIIFKRWNVAIGIPDRIFFLLTTMRGLNYKLLAIPISSISAKISPPGMESAVNAFTSGVAMFCNISTTMLGAGIISWSGMTTIGENCDFRAFPYLVTTFQICLPLAVGIPAVFMIPNVLQTERMIDWEKEKWCADGAPDLAKFVKKIEGQQQQEEEEEKETRNYLI